MRSNSPAGTERDQMSKHDSGGNVDVFGHPDDCPRCGSDTCDGRCKVHPATQAGLAERWLKQHGHRFAWVPARGNRGTWYTYANNLWTEDCGQLRTSILALARDLCLEAAAADDDQRKVLLRFALSCEQAGTVDGVVKFCQALAHTAGRTFAQAQFDPDTWMIHCRNGALDLRTGELYSHSAAHMMTRSTGVDYDPDARSDTWDKLIAQAMPDEELRSYVQRACGSSLVGPREEKVFFIHGDTGTSKSTFMEAVHAGLGRYYQAASFETFLHKPGPASAGPRQDLAVLQGARIVAASESDENRRLASAVLKNVSGGEDITVRMLYGVEFSYKPTYTVWFRSNHRPHASADDEAVWRRLKEIPFNVKVPEDQQDSRIKAELIDPEQSGSAVLRWLVDGCLAWQQQGLGKSKVVIAATEEYRNEYDTLGDFLNEVTESSPRSAIALVKLRLAYDRWCGENGASQLGPREFRRRLNSKGYDYEHTRAGNRVRGLMLKHEYDREASPNGGNGRIPVSQRGHISRQSLQNKGSAEC